MKVVHIITGLSTGGAEMMLFKVLSRMNRSRFEPVVISLSKTGEIADRLRALSIEVHSLNIEPGKISPIGFARLVRLLRRLKPDIIQGWMYHGNLSAQLASIFLLRKVPLLWNIRGMHTNLAVEKFLTALTIWLGARLSRLPVKIINNSRMSAASHEKRLRFSSDRWVIIPNGFDTELFSPSDEARKDLRTSLGLPGDCFLIGLVGRYHPVKDHDTFLTAAAHLLKTHREVRFVLVGQGIDSANEALMARVGRLGLNGSLHLLGKRDDTHHLTAAFDIACSSSHGEGFPNVIGEAMACGVPCVVTDVGDSAYLVGETGRVVLPRDPIALANAWRALIELDAESRKTLGQAARQRIVENFSLDAVVKQYEALYEDVYCAAGRGKR